MALMCPMWEWQPDKDSNTSSIYIFLHEAGGVRVRASVCERVCVGGILAHHLVAYLISPKLKRIQISCHLPF